MIIADMVKFKKKNQKSEKLKKNRKIRKKSPRQAA
jgi:hypothetical protein